MSALTTQYDAFITRLNALLTSSAGWNRLPNAYDLADNSDNFLKKGWGLALGDAQNSRRELSCHLSVRRTFIVVLTMEAFVLDHDVSGRATVEKALIEALRLVFRDFEKHQQLNTGQQFCAYESDNGIEFVRGEQHSFLALRASFTTEYFEDLN